MKLKITSFKKESSNSWSVVSKQMQRADENSLVKDTIAGRSNKYKDVKKSPLSDEKPEDEGL